MGHVCTFQELFCFKAKVVSSYLQPPKKQISENFIYQLIKNTADLATKKYSALAV